MDDAADIIRQFVLDARDWLEVKLLSIDSGLQLAVLIAVFIFIHLIGRYIKRWDWAAALPTRLQHYKAKIEAIVSPLIKPVIAIFLLWFAVYAFGEAGINNQIIKPVVSLLNAWVIIRLVSGALEDSGWSKAVSVIVWAIAALNIVGLLELTTQFLGAMSFDLGSMSFSALGVIKGLVAISILFWLFSLIERAARRKIASMTNITPSAKVLLNKFFRVSLVLFAILISMDAMGIDLTALAVFGGAIGIGLGFGLQKVAANLISGVILLVDRSVKPGDVISLGDTYGRIDKLGGRYVSVITRDGTEHLIPNEELITQRVENWSFSDTNIREKVTISIDYSSDLELAMSLCLDACKEVDRIVDTPAARCLLLDFADNGVLIQVRYWVNDAQNGLGGVRSDFLLQVWKKFHENNIQFPFPQRDIHIKEAVPVYISDAPKEDEQ
ncbi:MAG: mechanosensitive ion channel [Alphaproteobacteria bacterium]|nr:mechanosensitive ion channel [Alphaproteobacteria bacterium]